MFTQLHAPMLFCDFNPNAIMPRLLRIGVRPSSYGSPHAQAQDDKAASHAMDDD